MSERIRIGIQMWTVRESMAKDPEGTIRAVAAAGYEGVQFAGWFGLSAQKLADILASCGIAAAGAHVDFGLLRQDERAQFDFAHALGLSYITVPWIQPELLLESGTLGELRRLSRDAAADGLVLSYHNHDREFAPGPEGYPMDRLMDAVPELKMELDMYWAAFAGADPVGYLKKYCGRVPSVHIKDMPKNAQRDAVNPNIGEGELDIPGYLSAAQANGAGWAFVEMDKCSGPETESARISMKNILKMGYGA
jgi:sugar phosphate isomerase/epimerase